jgi:hypothetical protein
MREKVSTQARFSLQLMLPSSQPMGAFLERHALSEQRRPELGYGWLALGLQSRQVVLANRPAQTILTANYQPLQKPAPWTMEPNMSATITLSRLGLICPDAHIPIPQVETPRSLPKRSPLKFGNVVAGVQG